MYPSQVLARNLGALRRLRGYRQELVAERMNYLGHPWTRQTISEVERGKRNVTVDELFSLALALHITVDRLLDARVDRLLDPRAKRPGALDPRKVALVRPTSVAANRANTESPEMLVDAGDLHAILCGHEVDAFVTWDSLGRLRMVEFHDKGEERP
jgi:transcriptional regulator with XRE-family HTH domain